MRLSRRPSLRRSAPLAGVAAVLAAVLVVPMAATAVPTCTNAATRAACGGRVIAPPLQTATFLQYGLEYAAVLTAIEGLAPEFVDVKTVGDWIGNAEARSKGGRQMWVARVTDESVADEGKRQVAISLSVHANESAGREGGLRYLEDLARWSKEDPHHLLYAGDRPVKLSDVLRETEIYIGVMNVDGWAVGDAGGNGPIYSRGNSTGADLNRDLPTIGWTKQNQLAQPEMQHWNALVAAMPRLTTATDIHGELTSAANAFSDIMYPAGQWTPTQQAQELQLAAHMARTVERKFAEEGVVLQTLMDTLGERRPMKPASFATAYDVVGYDDSGFMGDWFVRHGAVEVDVENFMSHTVPSNIWFPPLEQAHVAAVKGNMEAVIAESMITSEVRADLDLGAIAYVVDPDARVEKASDATGELFVADRLDYFRDLAAEVDSPVVALDAADVATTDLSQFDSVVLSDTVVPADAQGRPVDDAAYLAALDGFAKGGGQLVLLDSAVRLLPQVGRFTDAQVRTFTHPAGHVNFGTRDHRWEQGLQGVASQTFYAVPLGYRSGSSIREAPHTGIEAAAWSAAGGVTVGTVDSNRTVNLGELPHGDGSIAIFGAILPKQTTRNRVDHGLADYAVSVTGGEVLHAILSYQR